MRGWCARRSRRPQPSRCVSHCRDRILGPSHFRFTIADVERRRRPVIPSDTLASIRSLAVQLPALKPLFGDIPRVDVVVDANIILEEISYLAKSRRDATARTALQELIASGTVMAFAPLTLVAEVERHIPKIAERRRADAERLRAVWLEYRALLHFFEPDPLTDEQKSEAADPDDIPYKELWLQLGARAIYTNDRHLPRMGADVVRFEVFLSLREYARAASVELIIRFGGGLAVVLGIGAIASLVMLTRTIAGGIARLSPAAKLVLGVVVVGLLAHPKSRNATVRGLKAIPGLFAQAAEVLGPVVTRVSEELLASSTAAKASLNAARTNLPAGPKRRTVRMRARAICIASKEPLSVASIEARMRADGYASAGRTARQYLLRVLRTDPRLREAPPGFWTAIRSPAVEEAGQSAG